MRKVLDNEREVLLNPSATDLSPANYSFRFLRIDSLNGQPCFLLELNALRKSTNLINGTACVDPTTYLVTRLEGEPAKAPSWWIRDIHIELHFHQVSGMWLQTGFSSTANVKLLGQHTLVSRDVEYKMEGAQAEMTTMR